MSQTAAVTLNCDVIRSEPIGSVLPKVQKQSVSGPLVPSDTPRRGLSAFVMLTPQRWAVICCVDVSRSNQKAKKSNRKHMSWRGDASRKEHLLLLTSKQTNVKVIYPKKMYPKRTKKKTHKRVSYREEDEGMKRRPSSRCPLWRTQTRSSCQSR